MLGYCYCWWFLLRGFVSYFFVKCIMFASGVIYKLCVSFKTFYCCLLRLNWCALCWYRIYFFLFGIVLSSTLFVKVIFVSCSSFCFMFFVGVDCCDFGVCLLHWFMFFVSCWLMFFYIVRMNNGCCVGWCFFYIVRLNNGCCVGWFLC